MTLRYILVSDGSSDAALMPVIAWSIRAASPFAEVDGEWAELGRTRAPPRSLAGRLSAALELYGPCHLLFVHRDAEGQGRGARLGEISAAVGKLPTDIRPPYVCVIPVRMTEAWLLADTPAIRRAAGNPNSTAPLRLPPLRDLEDLVDPKGVLYESLRAASGLSGRRLRTFRPEYAARRVPLYTAAFAALRELPAFLAFEGELSTALTALGAQLPAL